ncbi:hypothetical protein TRIUR3_32647 [Triticum urartu]|uniref:Uncharacterized protein n=1 Tax=Triticum urartu TaxID=4572 RepID=M8A9Y9_TRIUA|nr:hypothetical protein TRIUR3_32647 [Triticum urartu]
MGQGPVGGRQGWQGARWAGLLGSIERVNAPGLARALTKLKNAGGSGKSSRSGHREAMTRIRGVLTTGSRFPGDPMAVFAGGGWIGSSGRIPRKKVVGLVAAKGMEGWDIS